MDPSVAQAAAFAAQFHQPPPPPYQQPHQPPYSAELYPNPVTNPNPTPQTNNLSQPLPSHPSYAEMITAAISWENSQGKESGSSKRAIAKYIDRVYTNLPPSHSALLTHHLKRLKTAGQLVMVKNSYQLPSVATNLPRSVEPQQTYEPPSVVDQSGPVSGTPKRKPGRPPKLKTPESKPVVMPEPVSVMGPGLDQVVENGSSLGKRRRGRPAKERSPAVEVMVPFVAPVTDVAVVSNGQVSKRRGRPAKAKTVVNGEVAVGVAKGRGRPKGIGMKVGGSNVMAVVAVEKKRGWPKGKKRGKKVVNGGVARGVGVNGVGVVKRRGRKPKGFGLGLGLGVGVGVGMGGVMKRRGRKPKVVGVVSVGVGEKKVYSGKPRGRPKKNSAIVKHTDRKSQETNEELLKKLEDMQLKIRGAVEVLKPHLGSESAPDALTALQQLEELSAMNITASTTLIESPPMTTVPVDMVAPPEITPEPETSVPLSAPSMDFDAPPGMSLPTSSPFSVNVTGIENQQQMSWIES